MRQGRGNYARFYAALNKLPCVGSKEEMKCDFVRQYTNNRTDSLREMRNDEYLECCKAIEALSEDKIEQRQRRSECLKLMQKLGIDTTCWSRVNDFCKDRRISGKRFAYLTNEELESLSIKLRSIQRKGGLKKKEVKHESSTTYVVALGGGNFPIC